MQPLASTKDAQESAYVVWYENTSGPLQEEPANPVSEC